ncbi:MAG: hypothetical protein L6R48_15520, partial [Planctomycetes bacterium]|nr:hypothetical protein [Planctomycetota bacterium]
MIGVVFWQAQYAVMRWRACSTKGLRAAALAMSMIVFRKATAGTLGEAVAGCWDRSEKDCASARSRQTGARDLEVLRSGIRQVDLDGL